MRENIEFKYTEEAHKIQHELKELIGDSYWVTNGSFNHFEIYKKVFPLLRPFFIGKKIARVYWTDGLKHIEVFVPEFYDSLKKFAKKYEVNELTKCYETL